VGDPASHLDHFTIIPGGLQEKRRWFPHDVGAPGLAGQLGGHLGHEKQGFALGRERLAGNERRSISNYVEIILEDHVQKAPEQAAVIAIGESPLRSSQLRSFGDGFHRREKGTRSHAFIGAYWLRQQMYGLL
jgi:hypothetical protein